MRSFALPLALLLAVVAGPGARLLAEPPNAMPAGADLVETITSLDATVFDAYNRCDLDKLATFFAEDLEFYHDKTGLMRSRQSMIEAVQRNICGKVRRDLVPGTLEVFPLQGYGAVQLGSHRFCPSTAEHCDESSGAARFIHLWQNDGAAWKITRVVSYDHGGN